MIGLDTNVVVRYVAQDDTQQSPKATAMIESLSTDEPGFITMVSMVELVWILQSCYQATKEETVNVLETILRTRELVVEQAEIVWQALRRFDGAKADFADCLIERCASAAGCPHIVTFDKQAANTAGMRLLN
ncbi:type II toxin-antitoxin system VapC family toxin [Halomonas sp. KAO]|uniref:PIN domain-containing protein n=1 Tax=Halomonas sp. KAO TaxID=2783858 RepID=UPI0018A07AEC|nr:type II toxin-antitoxin system VapC family toxin [Halomonas sp. KAO]MBF7054652.1 type II toxin-antitoxin system VapC family toxin [Halomonas sp. KAO]